MNGPQHYAEAERLLVSVTFQGSIMDGDIDSEPEAQANVAGALVHAVLALVAATAEPFIAGYTGSAVGHGWGEADLVTACRSCGAQVIFGKSVVSGKSIPLDVEEVEPGTGVLLLTRAGVAWPLARALAEQSRPEGTLHLSHFATCPNADDWRKR